MRQPKGYQRVLLHLFVLVGVAFFTLPLIWVLATSLKPASEYYSSGIALLPKEPTLQHYRSILTPEGADAAEAEVGSSGGDESSVGAGVLRTVKNSVMVTSLTVCSTILLSTPMAYALARYRFRGGRNMGMWVLSTRMVPPITAVIPQFLLIRHVGLYDNIFGLVIPYTVANIPLAVWSLKQVFEDLPAELEEAAQVDGASRWRAFFAVTLPLAAGGIVATALLVMFLSWGEFIFAAILTVDSAVTLPVGLSMFLQDRGTLFGGMSATIVIAVIPMMIVVFFFQRYLVRGLTAGGIKA